LNSDDVEDLMPIQFAFYIEIEGEYSREIDEVRKKRDGNPH